MFDLVLLAIIGISALLGLMRGFVGIVVGAASWLLSGWAAFQFGGAAGRWLAGHTPAACETAYWIQDVAEGKRPDDIEKFREQLRPNTGGKPPAESRSA